MVFDSYLVLRSDLDLISSRLPESELDVRENTGLTLIAAMLWRDCILLGADSQAVESEDDLRLSINKLQRHDSNMIAWGTSGNPALGIDQFTTWLQSYAWPPKSKDQFKNEVAMKVAEINGEQRKRLKAAGVEESEDKLKNRLFSALVAARLDDNAFIFVVNNDGEFGSFDDLELHAIGSGKGHVKVINTTIRNLKPPPFSNPIKQFKFTVNLAAGLASTCSTPTVFLKLDRDGITELGS